MNILTEKKLMPETVSAQVIFWEKPGCVGNARQKTVLQKHGFELVVRDLLTTSWNMDTLRPFFSGKPLHEWFNASAAVIKSGEVKPAQLNEHQALSLMVESPLLICRPLMQFGELKQCGFVAGPVLDALKVKLDPEQDLQSCAMMADESVCGVAV